MSNASELERPESGDLATLEDQDQELVQRSSLHKGGDDLVLPMLRLTQKTSKDVEDGKRESGRYVNSLTDRDYGTKLDFVIVERFKGRFLSIRKTGETFVAFGEEAPANWPAEYAGKRFDEIPDAEETYKERANAGEIEWDKGPKIQTTRNFIGFVPDEPEIPVRLSLKSTGLRAASKINSLLDWRLKAYWHNLFHLGVRQDSDLQDNTYFVATAELGEETPEELRQNAREMFNAIHANLANLRLVGEEQDAEPAPAKPDAGGGLDVG